MKKNQKKINKKEGIKKQMENTISIKAKKTITNIFILVVMLTMLLVAIYIITLVVNFLTNIVTMKIIFLTIAIVLIISTIYIIKK